MKVRAKHWLNFDGTWYCRGEVFDLPAAEAERLRGSVEWVDVPVGNSEQIVEGIRQGAQEAMERLFDTAETAEAVHVEPKKRRRKPKTEE